MYLLAVLWFSSALSCIQTHILADGYTSIHNIDPGLTCWWVDFLTDRSVKVRGLLFDALLSSTSSLHGCVLSPLFFVLCTNECHCHYEGRHIKFADNSVIVSLLSNDETNCGPVVEEFNDWCFRHKCLKQRKR